MTAWPRTAKAALLAWEVVPLLAGRRLRSLCCLCAFLPRCQVICLLTKLFGALNLALQPWIPEEVLLPPLLSQTAEFKHQRQVFDTKARQWTQRHAMPGSSEAAAAAGEAAAGSGAGGGGVAEVGGLESGPHGRWLAGAAC